MEFLTREQVNLLSIKDCKQQLKDISKEYDLDKPLHLIWQQVWDNLDDIVNTILYLEDRIKHLELSENLTKINLARWADKKSN